MAKFDVQKYANKGGFKTFLWVLLGVFVLFFFTKIMKLISNLFESKDDKQEEERVKTATASVNSISVKTHELTKPKATLETISSSIQGLMDTYISPFNASKVYSQLATLKGQDLMFIYKHFGVKTRTAGADKTGDLLDWFTWSFNETDLYKLQMLFIQTTLRRFYA